MSDVPFECTVINYRSGWGNVMNDFITIESIKGPTDNINTHNPPPGQYIITGTYILGSKQTAHIRVSFTGTVTTSSSNSSMKIIEEYPIVNKGSGTFTAKGGFIELKSGDGSLHLSVGSGNSFGFDVIPIAPGFCINPTASFTIQPLSGDTSTIFNFNANGCNDIPDPTSDLRVMWDWENDGIFDTEMTATKTVEHKFTKPGQHTVCLKVIDTGELTGITTRDIDVSIEY